ncbi:hypothetical protein GOODEAATRI_034280 [Goodea atripinnis]|uniref:Uncharacterized protein n=1 Tax=Goodea atripinnis TaxID=208336 RepID=A0ABV0PA16_9TELE
MIQTMCELCIMWKEVFGKTWFIGRADPNTISAFHSCRSPQPSPQQKLSSVMLSGHTEVVGEERYPCVCKAVKRGAEEAASLAAKSALLFPYETTSVEDVCAAHLHTEIAFGKRIAPSRLET